MKIIEEKPVTIATARKLLRERKREAEEKGEILEPYQLKALEYVEEFSKIKDAEKAEELVDKLVKEAKLSREVAVQLINCLPEHEEELRPFLSQEDFLFAPDREKRVRKIMEILREARREG